MGSNTPTVFEKQSKDSAEVAEETAEVAEKVLHEDVPDQQDEEGDVSILSELKKTGSDQIPLTIQ